MKSITLSFCIAPLLASTVLAGPGFTEPPIVFYGKVSNTRDGYTLDLASGAIAFTVQPTGGGAPLTVSSTLHQIGGGYSYRVSIPVEKVPSGFTVSSGSLAAPPTVRSFAREASINGQPATITLPVMPEGGVFTFAENLRGKIERLDFTVSVPFDDTDEDGVPDWWEMDNGYDPTDPFDADDDRDGDTAGPLAEYTEHTSPDHYEYNYRRWANQHQLTGAEYPMDADVDGDGIPNSLEFGIDSDPRLPDPQLAYARITGGVQTITGTRYSVLNVTKPALVRTQTAYIIESSRDLQLWGGLENVDVVTLTDTTLLRRARAALSLDAPGNNRLFFRLRIEETP